VLCWYAILWDDPVLFLVMVIYNLNWNCVVVIPRRCAHSRRVDDKKSGALIIVQKIYAMFSGEGDFRQVESGRGYRVVELYLNRGEGEGDTHQ
jgi:hypothetical protein